MAENTTSERDRKAALIQRAATALPSSQTNSVDTARPLTLDEQLPALESRLSGHLERVLGVEGATEVNQLQTAILDCETALRGIGGVVKLRASKEYSQPEVAAIARRSFEVLRQLALDRGISDKRSILNTTKPKSWRELETMPPRLVQRVVVPERLELVEAPLAFVRVIGQPSDLSYDKMPCPAFLGKPAGLPRLPNQLWGMVIDVYQACGELATNVKPNAGV